MNKKEKFSLKNRLILFDFFLKLFGVKEFSGLRNLLSGEKEYFDEDGYSFYFNALKGLENKKIADDKLREYDENIKSYVDRINRYREPKINLKYFQYLVVLFTEIFLDQYFNNRDKFLSDINNFVKNVNQEKQGNFPYFTEIDLTKIAFWMATGSGKTLIMHINYLQFKKYNRKRIDNILLITPNASLSEQHLEELQKSGIGVSIFSESNQSDEIKILEITKLTETKKGKGKSVEASSFEGNNLVFVDEGHKGFSGSAWKKLRDKISEIGFTFEYSATFDEAIGPSKNIELLEEYSKSIIMDYSYRYFYEDGFGKKFTVMNLKEGKYKKRNLIFTLNLLSYYQQLGFYNDNCEKIKPFNFEKPLWIFVGSSVISNKKNGRTDKQTLSDVQTVVRYINEFLQNKDEFINLIEKIIKDEIKFEGKDGYVVYPSDGLEYIKSSSAEKIYNGIIKQVFQSNSSGNLELVDIKNSEGEIGLKLATSERYFGLVFIGDTASFKEGIKIELEKGKIRGIVFSEEHLLNSLFYGITTSESAVNILIGAKKFIEGWDCYRVSSMGLLNIGRSKGSQIMQLFGRGVRLYGYKKLMKRSEFVNLEYSKEIAKFEKMKKEVELGILETLKIFGIKAEYVKKFEEELHKQDIYPPVSIPLRIKTNKEFLSQELIIPKIETEKYDELVMLKKDDNLYIPSLDTTSKFEIGVSGSENMQEVKVDTMSKNLRDFQEYINWDELYFELLQYKNERNFTNLYIEKNILKDIINNFNFSIKVDRDFDFYNFSDYSIVQKWALALFKKYIKSFYIKHRDYWYNENLGVGLVREKNELFQDYTVEIEKKPDNLKLIDEIDKLIKKGDKIYKGERTKLPTVYFDRHLYQPLIVDENQAVKSSPPPLNTSEKIFIENLKEYFRTHKNDDLVKENRFFILRNVSKSGIGFFIEETNFYPDFIIWILCEDSQKIVFVDPHGLYHNERSFDAPKIKFAQKIKDIEKKMNGKYRKKSLKLFSFIIHHKDFNDVKKFWTDKNVKEGDFYNNNVLFQQDSYYIKKLFKKIK